MDKKSEPVVHVTDEQYAALIAELVPTIVEFYNSEKGQILFAEYMHDKESNGSTAVA